MTLKDIAQNCAKYSVDLAKGAVELGSLYVGLAKAISPVVSPVLTVVGVVGGSAVAGTLIAKRIDEIDQKNQAGLKKPVQKAELVQSKVAQKADPAKNTVAEKPVQKAEPVKSKAAEMPVKSEIVKKYYVKKADPVKSKAAETPVQNETGKKYYVKKAEPAKSKAAETPVQNETVKKYYVKKAEPVKNEVAGAEKSAQGVADPVKTKLHELFSNKVVVMKFVDASHVHAGDSSKVDLTGSVVTEGAAVLG